MDNRGQFMPLGDDNPRKTTPYMTWGLIGLNVIVFLISLTAFERIIDTYGFKPGAFSLLTILTSMFLHGGIAHIVGNMWFLFIFGDNVEDRLGHLPYLLFYLIAGFAASLSHYFLNLGSMVPAVGASGAISGVLGAYLVFFPKAGVYVSGGFGRIGRINAWIMLGVWFLFQVVQASLLGNGSGIAFAAHIGGFVFGMIVGGIVRLFKK